MGSTAEPPSGWPAAHDGSAGGLHGAWMKILESVCLALRSLDAPFALIGGRAVALRGYPRTTFDYDFLTGDRRVLQRDLGRARARMRAPELPERARRLAGDQHRAGCTGIVRASAGKEGSDERRA
jgi:hypothetical protein